MEENSLEVKKVLNGWLLITHGTMEQQDDGIDNRYVFETVEKLTEWIKEYFSKQTTSSR